MNSSKTSSASIDDSVPLKKTERTPTLTSRHMYLQEPLHLTPEEFAKEFQHFQIIHYTDLYNSQDKLQPCNDLNPADDIANVREINGFHRSSAIIKGTSSILEKMSSTQSQT